MPTVDRFVGAAVGAAVGDVVGYPFEFSRRPGLWGRVAPTHSTAVLRRYGQPPGFLGGLLGSEVRYTDDTEMAIAVMTSLLEVGALNTEHMGRRFGERAGSGMAAFRRGYGPGTRRWLAAIHSGMDVDAAASSSFGNRGSFGNGGAMRAYPCALAAHIPGDLGQSVDKTVALAEDVCRVTHRHPLGVEGAVFVAVAVAYALQVTVEAFSANRLIQLLEPRAQSDEYRAILEDLRVLLRDFKGVTIADMDKGSPQASAMLSRVKEKLGNQSTAQKSVGTALFAVMRHQRSFQDTIREAIYYGGDTDTIASMAGAISGALIGYDGICAEEPHVIQPLVEARLEDGQFICDLARRLAEPAATQKKSFV